MPTKSFVSLPALVAGLILNGAVPAAAATDEADNRIVVSALRVPLDVDRVAGSVTVLDSERIAQDQPVAITDILLRTPGLALTRNGGFGTATSLRIRGATPGQSVLVIDGMRLADASTTDGGADFANLLADDIERIEILRGPQSILWGSNAIGGVVNLVTARPTAPRQLRVSIEGGSRETLNARAAVGGASEALDWRLAGSTFTTAGISARDAGTERDGFRRQSASGTLTARLAPAVSLDLRGYYSTGRNDFDGFSGDSEAYGLTDTWAAYAGLNFTALGGRLSNRVAIMENRTDRDNFDPARSVRSQTFDAQGRTRRYEYQGNFAATENVQIAFGAEREEQRMRTASPGDDTSTVDPVRARADIDSVYAQLRFAPLTGVDVEAGLRHDDHSRFGGNTVFSVGTSLRPWAAGPLLKASYAEGFKAPSLYQLYTQYGSAALKPETAEGWEVGIEQGILGDRAQLSAVYFRRNSTNLIDFAYCPTSGPVPPICYIPGTEVERFGYYANVAASRAQGVELAGDARFGPVFARGNFSWVEAEDRSEGATFGEQLPRVPRYLANATLGYAAPSGHSLSVALRYAGQSRDRAGGDVLDDYLLTDLRGELQAGEGLSLYGRVENLFDTDYTTAKGYGTLGRSVYVGVRARL